MTARRYVCTGSADQPSRPGCGRGFDASDCELVAAAGQRTMVYLPMHHGCGWRSAWLDEQGPEVCRFCGEDRSGVLHDGEGPRSHEFVGSDDHGPGCVGHVAEGEER